MLGLSQERHRVDDPQPPGPPPPPPPGDISRPGPSNVPLGRRRRNVRGYADVLEPWQPEVEPVAPIEFADSTRRRSVSTAAREEAGPSRRSTAERSARAQERSSRPSVHLSTPEATLPAFGVGESSRHSISFGVPSRIGDYSFGVPSRIGDHYAGSSMVGGQFYGGTSMTGFAGYEGGASTSGFGGYQGGASTSRGAQQEDWPTTSTDYSHDIPSTRAPSPDAQSEDQPQPPRRGQRQRRGRTCGTGGHLAGPHR